MNEPSAAAYVYGASMMDAAPYARHMLVRMVSLWHLQMLFYTFSTKHVDMRRVSHHAGA